MLFTAKLITKSITQLLEKSVKAFFCFCVQVLFSVCVNAVSNIWLDPTYLGTMSIMANTGCGVFNRGHNIRKIFA